MANVMNCTEIKESLSLYLDGELDAVQMEEIKGHLAECGECRREYEALLEVTRLLRAIPDASLPEGFDAGLKTALRKEKAAKSARVKKMQRMAGSLAAVFVIGFFSITLYNHTYQGNQELNQADYYALSAGAGVGEPAEEALATSANEDAGVQEEADVIGEPAAQAPAYDTVGGQDAPAPEPNEHVSREEAPRGEPAGEAAGEPARQLTISISDEAEAESADLSARAKIAIDYYLKLISAELEGFEYEVTGYRLDEDGTWIFEVELYTFDENGIDYTELYTYAGQDGKIWIKESSSSTETAC